MTSNSKTPRTDALLDRLDRRKAGDAEGSMLLIAHAQQLEEELGEHRVERYREALRTIINPLPAMQANADMAGATLDGARAARMADEPSYLRQIARFALDDASEVEMQPMQPHAPEEHARVQAECAEIKAAHAPGGRFPSFEAWWQNTDHGYSFEILKVARAAWDAALAAPSAVAEHVCGLAGYNGMIDPPCPACAAGRKSPPPGLTQATWPALRELIQAEARLAALRARVEGRRGQSLQHEDEEIAQLEEQVTRMETAVREALPNTVSPERKP